MRTMQLVLCQVAARRTATSTGTSARRGRKPQAGKASKPKRKKTPEPTGNIITVGDDANVNLELENLSSDDYLAAMEVIPPPTAASKRGRMDDNIDVGGYFSLASGDTEAIHHTMAATAIDDSDDSSNISSIVLLKRYGGSDMHDEEDQLVDQMMRDEIYGQELSPTPPPLPPSVFGNARLSPASNYSGSVESRLRYLEDEVQDLRRTQDFLLSSQWQPRSYQSDTPICYNTDTPTRGPSLSRSWSSGPTSQSSGPSTSMCYQTDTPTRAGASFPSNLSSDPSTSNCHQTETPARGGPSLPTSRSSRPRPLPEIRKNQKNLSSSAILDWNGRRSIDEVIEANHKFTIKSKISTLALRIARDAVFGEEVMRQCTVMGNREYPGLPRPELLKKHYTRSSQNCGMLPRNLKYWSDCIDSIGQGCKRMRKS